MKRTTQVISALGLSMTIVPSLLFFANQIAHSTVLITGTLGTVIWFAATPLWMSKD